MATDINKVILVGRLTRDCEMKQISNNSLCEFSIAINRRTNKGGEWSDEPNFFDCQLWGRLGEALQNYLKKGQQVAVEGSLRQNRWETAEGQKHSRVIINIDNLQLTGGRGSSGTDSNSYSQPQHNVAASDSQAAPAPQASNHYDNNELKDDIPF